MSMQFHFVYSQFLKGAGIFAGCKFFSIISLKIQLGSINQLILDSSIMMELLLIINIIAYYNSTISLWRKLPAVSSYPRTYRYKSVDCKGRRQFCKRAHR